MVYWELENDGCESDFIVSHFENRIYMHAHVNFESRFCAMRFLKYLRYNWLYMHAFDIKMCRKKTQPQYNNN